MRLSRPSNRSLAWAIGVIAFCAVFVGWRVWIVDEVEGLRAEIDGRRTLVRRMTSVMYALRDLERTSPVDGGGQGWENAFAAAEAALAEIESDGSAVEPVLPQVGRIRSELDEIHGLRKRAEESSPADGLVADRTQLDLAHDRAFAEARAAIEVTRARLTNVSEQLGDKWKQVNLLGIVGSLMAVALAGVVYALRVALTRSKAAEARERVLEAESSRADRLATMGEMAAGLAHQLNQPLTSIHTYLAGCRRRLQETNGDHKVIVEAMEEAQAEARRASSIVERIRTFVSGQGMRPAPVLVNELVQEARILVAGELRSRHIQLSLLLGENLPLVRADRIHVGQVLVNVVRNAIEAMKSRPPDERVLTIRTSPVDGDEVEVAISDTGAGLTPEEWKHLFEPFHTSKHSGLGLGLAISRRIIEAHGGRIWVEPNRGFGITLRFRLPCAKEKR